MYLFAGLGNIGREYAGTRHNIGFEVVDYLEPRLERSSGWRAGRGDYYFAKGFRKAEEILLIKPTTYMNLSGRAIRDALAFYKIERNGLVVIADDIALPLGTLRLRTQGSDGGHNGLASVIYELGSDEFARLRCGVGSDFRRGEQVKYVLSKFKTGEIELVTQMIEKASDACMSIVEQGILKAMNSVNAPSV
ncbi:MAG TPA: aminoacyl-tRNA hydrolase [Candidatus Kapabacteria bacterium]|nr:aminoacyl-tRNA hydrolase [Candidatus Kapabacteria bacterium]